MITIAHCYNEIINHYDISTQEKLGGGKLRQQPHSVANPTKAEHAHQAQKQMASQTSEKTRPTSDVLPVWYKNNGNRLSSPCLPRADYSYRHWGKRKNITDEKRPKTEQKLRSENNASPYIRNTRPISDVFPVRIIRITIKSSLQPMPAESDNFEWYGP